MNVHCDDPSHRGRPARRSRSSRAPRAGATRPLRLTLDDAVARGLDASHRLAELRARAGRRRRRPSRAGRRPSRPQVSALAGYTRTNHVDEFGIPADAGPSLRSSTRTSRTTTGPASISSGRSTRSGALDALERAARAEADASGQDVAAARNDLQARDHARVLGGRHRHARRSACVDESLQAHGRHARRRAQPAEGRPGPAERRARRSRRNGRGSRCC